MKNASLVFTPNTAFVSPSNYRDILKNVLSGKMNGPAIPTSVFDDSVYQCPVTNAEYHIETVFEMADTGTRSFCGLRVETSPSECLMGHNVLPAADMDTTRRLAFALLQQGLKLHYGDEDFAGLFDEHKVFLDDMSMSQYWTFPSHEAARLALQQIAEELSEVLGNRLTRAGTLREPVWRVRTSDNATIHLYVPDDPLHGGYSTNHDKARKGMASDELLAYARAVLVADLELDNDKLIQVGADNPLVWDLPNAAVYKYLNDAVNRLLGVGNRFKFSPPSTAPKEIRKQTFSRQSAASLLRDRFGIG